MVKEEALVLIAVVLAFILSDSTSCRGFIGMVVDDNKLSMTEKEIPPTLQKENCTYSPVKGVEEFNVDVGRKNELIHGGPVLFASGCGGCGGGYGNAVKGGSCGSGCGSGCGNMVKGGGCGSGCGDGCRGGGCGNRVKSASCGGCGSGCRNMVSRAGCGGCGASGCGSYGAGGDRVASTVPLEHEA